LVIKASDRKTSTLLKKLSRFGDIRFKPYELNTLSQEFIDPKDDIGRETPIQGDTLVQCLEFGNESLARRIPESLLLRVRPTSRMTLKVIVSESVFARQVAAKATLSDSWDSC